AFVLLVNKNFPPKTVAEFVSYVRLHPKLPYAEGSAGSLTHLSMALFAKRAGLDRTNVSYRGNAPALTDVVAGHLQSMFSNVADPQSNTPDEFAALIATDLAVWSDVIKSTGLKF